MTRFYTYNGHATNGYTLTFDPTHPLSILVSDENAMHSQAHLLTVSLDGVGSGLLAKGTLREGDALKVE